MSKIESSGLGKGPCAVAAAGQRIVDVAGEQVFMLVYSDGLTLRPADHPFHHGLRTPRPSRPIIGLPRDALRPPCCKFPLWCH